MRELAFGRRHGPFGIGDGQRDRLFHEHVLAGLDGPDGGLGVELRRQRHDDAVDILARKQFVGRDSEAILFAGEAFGACAVGVGNGMQRAERLQGADMVGAPVPASKDCNTRFHQLPTQDYAADT